MWTRCFEGFLHALSPRTSLHVLTVTQTGRCERNSISCQQAAVQALEARECFAEHYQVQSRNSIEPVFYHIVNGWWLQPDCNLPDGEAFIREALYGKRYFRERFGVEVTVGYNVDSFGHAATLPMLLRHTGFSSYVFMRPMQHEHALPGSLFDWIAPDGSRVSAFRVPFSYNSPGSAPEMQHRLDQLAELARDEGRGYRVAQGNCPPALPRNRT